MGYLATTVLMSIFISIHSLCIFHQFNLVMKYWSSKDTLKSICIWKSESTHWLNTSLPILRLGHEFFCVEIGFEVLIPTKIEFCKILPLPLSYGGRCQKHFSKRNLSPNYFTIKKLPVISRYMNTKRLFLLILEFFILKGGKKEKGWILNNLGFWT